MPTVPDLGRRSVEGLLPHTGPWLLLTGIVRSEPGFIEATGEVSATHPLVTAGTAPCFLGLELGAQAAAALGALARRSASGVQEARVGYLVRVREATFLTPHLPTDTPLRVTARLEGSAPPLAVLRVHISVGGADLLRATLGTHTGAHTGAP